MLGLRHRHAVTRHDYNAVGLAKCCGYTVGVDCDLLAFDFHCRARWAAEATQDYRKELTVHRYAHDVGQDCTGRTNQRADHDQQIVAKHEACRCCCPTGIAVEHGNHDGHVCAADCHNQMCADCEGDEHHQQ